MAFYEGITAAAPILPFIPPPSGVYYELLLWVVSLNNTVVASFSFVLRWCNFNCGRNPPWRVDKRQCSFEVLNFTVEAFFKSAGRQIIFKGLIFLVLLGLGLCVTIVS